MVWATIRYLSCFCWLYRASSSLAAKNIINLNSVLAIWWCLCVESFLVLLEEGVCYDQCILLAYRRLKSTWMMLNVTIISEMQTTRMSYFLTLIRVAIIKMSTDNTHWEGCGENGIFLHCRWEYKLVQPLWRIVWKFLKKLKIVLPHYPAIPLLGIYSEKTINLKMYMHPPRCSLQHYL